MKKNKKNITFSENEKLSFRTALYITGDYNAAKKIASRTASLFLLNHPDKDTEDLKGKIYVTTRNFSYEHFRKQKRDEKLKDKYKAKLITEILPGETETDIRLREAFTKASQSLTDEQLRTLVLFNTCDHDYKQMQEITEISVPTLRKRISRIKAKLKAETNLNLGITYTQKIVTPELNNVLYKFLCRFKKNLEENTMHKMYRSFSKQDLENYNETIDIVKIKGWDIQKIGDEYFVMVIYLNSEGFKEAFDFKFTIANKNLKITRPPCKKKITASYKKGTPLHTELMKLKKMYPPDGQGRMTIPKELLDNLAKKYNKQKQEDT